MKAISLWQPYASLVGVAAKPYETRSWSPPVSLIGQTIAIHAAKKIDKAVVPFIEELRYGQHKVGGFDLADKLEASIQNIPDPLLASFGMTLMPVGCLICTAKLDAAFQLGERSSDSAVPAARVVRRMLSRPMPDCFTVRYDDFGDYEPGRWAWLLRDVKLLCPTEMTVGRQGFFDVPDHFVERMRIAA